jgi:uncharacterized membrane protein (UPF0127 family)
MRRPSILSSAPAWLCVGVALAPLGCGGCERRVEEPLPDVHPLHAPAPTQDAAPAPPGKPWGSRCVRETPKIARRTTPKSPDPACPKDTEKPPVLRSGKVTFPAGAGADGGAGNATTVTVEIAEKDKDRQRGLMYRTSMADDRGMIFWFEEKSDHAFWMHNTCIPLDMLYLDEDGLIVGIEENTPTLSDDTFDVGCSSKYVLELNAGWTRAHGVKPGQKVRIDGI